MLSSQPHIASCPESLIYHHSHLTWHFAAYHIPRFIPASGRSVPCPACGFFLLLLYSIILHTPLFFVFVPLIIFGAPQRFRLFRRLLTLYKTKMYIFSYVCDRRSTIPVCLVFNEKSQKTLDQWRMKSLEIFSSPPCEVLARKQKQDTKTNLFCTSRLWLVFRRTVTRTASWCSPESKKKCVACLACLAKQRQTKLVT